MKISVDRSLWNHLKNIFEWGESEYIPYEEKPEEKPKAGISDMLYHIRSIKNSIENAYEMSFFEIRDKDVYWFKRLLEEAEREEAASPEVVKSIIDKIQ